MKHALALVIAVALYLGAIALLLPSQAGVIDDGSPFGVPQIVMPQDMLPIYCSTELCFNELSKACAWAGRHDQASVGLATEIVFGPNNCATRCKGSGVIAVMHCRERLATNDATAEE